MLKTACALWLATASLLSAEVIYTPAELEHTRNRAVPSIKTVMWRDIVPRLPADLQDKARTVTLQFPDRGPGPMSFYASPTEAKIYMPLTSIRFYDDIATLQAWFESRGCSKEFIQTYLAALLRAGEDLPAPLIAFDLDRDVLFADDYTYDLSGKILSSGIQFLLAHELGHILLDHSTGLDGMSSQQQESAADDFAFDHFARLGGNPMGIFWFYQAAWWHDPATPEGRLQNTHPVSAERIRALGERLMSAPHDFAHGEIDPDREANFVSQLGMMAIGFADLIDDDVFLQWMAPAMFNDYPLTRLHEACPHP